LGSVTRIGIYFMKTIYTIIFLLCVLALAASEYVFLNELNNHQRFLILLLTSLAALVSVVAIFICYRRLGKEA